MLSKRIIPCLLIDEEKLIHIENFDKKKTRYIGDPINAINIFNDYEIDELVILDINATKKKINFDFLKKLSQCAFFPLSYGGGIKNELDAQKIINIGYEKIIINNEFLENTNVIENCVRKIGAQSVIISLDLILDNSNYFVYSHKLRKKINKNFNDLIFFLNTCEFGELLVTSVNKDGTMSGCEIDLIKTVSEKVNVPIIYKGGSSSYKDINECFKFNISGFSSATIFIMKQKNGGIVFNYPSNTFKKTAC